MEKPGNWMSAGLMAMFIGFWGLRKYKLLALTLSCGIALAANPSFLSNDIITYAIYGKILVYYHQLPWLVTPNMVSDSWMSLSHWASSTSRYGPIWMIMCGFAYLGGGGNLPLTLYLLKFFGLVTFCINIWLMRKLTKHYWAFALNPYIFVESVFNPHSDQLMTTFILLAICLKNNYVGWLAALIKITSLPVLLAPYLKLKNYSGYILLAFLGALLVITRWSLNSWYLFLPITLSTLMWNRKFFRYLVISLSVGCLLRYLPYAYLGFFDPMNKIRRDLFLVALVPFVGWVIFTTRKYWFRGNWQQVLREVFAA